MLLEFAILTSSQVMSVLLARGLRLTSVQISEAGTPGLGVAPPEEKGYEMG